MADRSGYIGRAPSDSSVIVSKQIFNPTESTTEFTFSSGYVVGYLDLYMNGVRLLELSDYTAHDGTTITLTSAATLGDTIEAVAYKAFSASTVSFASGSFSVGTDLSVIGNVSAGGSITAGTLYGNGSNLIGIDATSLKDSSDTVRVQANTDGAEVTGILTATSLSAESALIGTGVTLNSSGINVGVLTATNAFFSDVSIGGTITNMDSVGVITARSGIEIGLAGVGGTISAGGTATFAGTIEDSIGKLRSIPQNAKTAQYTVVAGDSGKHISITSGGVIIPAAVFNTGDTFSIYNNSSSTQIITQGSSVTLRYAGSASVGNRSLLQYGICTVLCVDSSTNTFVISGTGLN